MIIKERDGTYSVECFFCGDSIGAETWEEIKAVKSMAGWTSFMLGGKIRDACRKCRKEAREYDERGDQQAVTGSTTADKKAARKATEKE